MALALLAAGCSKSKEEGPKPASDRGTPPPIPSSEDAIPHVVVSIDWEGAFFRSEALDAMEKFREDHPGVPLTHLITAAYYTKPDADPVDATREIRLAVKKGDEVGLHVHAWKSLVEAAGVKPRLTPSFLSRENKLLEFEDDTGFDIDLSAYTVAELRAIFKKSRELFEAEKINVGTTFRAAGCLGTPNVLEAVRAEGYTIDSSATDPVWFDEPEVLFMQERLRKLWPRVTKMTQPYWIDTPAGKILEVPDNGALADYTQPAEIVAHIEQAAASAKTTGKPVIVVLGFHAETADEFAPRLVQALATLREKKVPMAFETLSAAAELAKKSQPLTPP